MEFILCLGYMLILLGVMYYMDFYYVPKEFKNIKMRSEIEKVELQTNDELIQKIKKDVNNYSEQPDKLYTKYEVKWNLSREIMPDYDGQYYVYGFMHHSCGNVTPFHKIVECKMNQWVKSDAGEQMTYWTNLLEPPKTISDEQ